MKNLMLSIIALIIMTSGKNPDTITGTVKDAKNQKALSGVTIELKNQSIKTVTDKNGHYSIEANGKQGILIFTLNNYVSKEVSINKRSKIDVFLDQANRTLEVVEIKEYEIEKEEVADYSGPPIMHRDAQKMKSIQSEPNVIYSNDLQHNQFNTEEYDVINENGFKDPNHSPLSTFSIDVDGASYSNIRRMINQGSLPPKDAVRVEELINYFTYDYPNPTGHHPFSITTEISSAPWNNKHQLVHIGLQGKMIDYNELKASNLVFLIDVSGSMSANNKLPLLVSSMKLLLDNLQDDDRVAVVVYAGAAGLVLPSTPVSEKSSIISALNRLSAGGSTAGGAGIKLAYDIAQQNFKENGNNRVILATDGDFNTGPSSTSDMVRLIEEKRDLGIYLTITGFGMGNYKDGRMEQISNAGNGNYFYIDNIAEAKKVFVKEMRATLFTIAKDVKIQVEFNPDQVQAYRLIGYENRKLNDEDFNDDKKDAGELGAGHTVTALYEIIPAGVKSEFVKGIDPLKYQLSSRSNASEEILTVKFRYKRPKENKSNLIVQSLKNESTELSETSNNFRFSAAVAEFGMIIRDSEFQANSSYNDVIELASSAKGKDVEGYRYDFIRMVESCKLMAVR